MPKIIPERAATMMEMRSVVFGKIVAPHTAERIEHGSHNLPLNRHNCYHPLWLAAPSLNFLGGRGKNRVMLWGLKMPGIGRLGNGTSAQNTKKRKDSFFQTPPTTCSPALARHSLADRNAIRVILNRSDTWSKKRHNCARSSCLWQCQKHPDHIARWGSKNTVIPGRIYEYCPDAINWNTLHETGKLPNRDGPLS